MSFSDDNNLEIPTSGVADWDSPLNGNFVSLARGFKFKATAGGAVNTGDVVSTNGAFVYRYDASSREGSRPLAVALTAVTSGSEAQFQANGTVRSLGVWSGHFQVGGQVFIDPASPGFLTSSYSAAKYPFGWALAEDAILVSPEGQIREKLTLTVSFSFVVGSAHAFEFNMGETGMVHQLNLVSDSVDNYKLRFWTGSLRVASEAIYETVTTSVDGAALDFDVATLNYLDRSTWSYWNTDVASPGLIFGTVDVQSSSAAGSGNASLTMIVERFA
ncbi:MAG: hypothetical protein V3S55_03845 [Nitrospiraceae bacterium]